jgi:FkbM family methyltransferase
VLGGSRGAASRLAGDEARAHGFSAEAVRGASVRAVGELAKVRAAFREWPAIALQGLLWKHLSFPRREIEIHSRAGTSIAAPLVHKVGALYTAVEVFALGAYECDWELEEDPMVIDIGANIGAWVLWLAERRPRLTGVCYEPDAAAATYLRSNLELNGLDDQVEVRSEAVSDRTGTARLFQEQPGGGASSLQPMSPVVRFKGATPVSTVSFTEAIERVPGDISVVKIDCEGAEYDIVESSPADSWRRIKRVVMEYHPALPGRHDALRKRFAELGFSATKEDRRTAELGTLWLARGMDSHAVQERNR